MAVPDNYIEQSIREFNMLMSRGLDFLMNQPPEDNPTPGDLAEYVEGLVRNYEQRFSHIKFNFSSDEGCEVQGSGFRVSGFRV